MSFKVLRSQPWIGTYPLNPFFDRLNELRSGEGKRRILILTKFRTSFYTILTTYVWIGFIQKRIDEDLFNDLEHHEMLRRVSLGERVTIHDLPPSNIHMTNIDIVSFIIFLNILLDDVARFLNFLFWGKSKPKTKDFDKLKKTIRNFVGPDMEELNPIIKHTDWYETLKELRDHPIVHQGDRTSQLGIIPDHDGDQIGIHLRYVKDRRIVETFISNREIDRMANDVHSFLEELNDFLCRRFEALPFEVDEL